MSHDPPPQMAAVLEGSLTQMEKHYAADPKAAHDLIERRREEERCVDPGAGAGCVDDGGQRDAEPGRDGNEVVEGDGMKQHPLCTDTEHGTDVMDLPIPAGLKQEWAALQTRRHFLGRTGKVLGWAAMASLLGESCPARRCLRADAMASPRSPAGERLKLPHFAPKAKRAIYLFMSGGPPQIDLLDYKPNLAALYDKDIPDSVRGAQQLTGMTAGQARFPIAPSHWGFKRYGQTGTWVSDLLPVYRRGSSMT